MCKWDHVRAIVRLVTRPGGGKSSSLCLSRRRLDGVPLASVTMGVRFANGRKWAAGHYEPAVVDQHVGLAALCSSHEGSCCLACCCWLGICGLNTTISLRKSIPIKRYALSDMDNSRVCDGNWIAAQSFFSWSWPRKPC